MVNLRRAVKHALHIEQVQQNLTDRVLQRLRPDCEALINVTVEHVRSECKACFDNTLQQLRDQVQIATQALGDQLRTEYTVMPRFQFHQPLDYQVNTYPIQFEPPVSVPGVELPVPAPDDRMGYAPNDAGDYLRWGALDHDLIMGHIKKHSSGLKNRTILDFGCSSGRVLRHFDSDRREHDWQLLGVDIQAKPIEWMRQNFPAYFQISACSTMPHLPFADNSIDFIYGISVFTHIKYLWDMWLLELKRVLKPGGLLMQTIHSEPAWRFYYTMRNESWVKSAHSAEMLERPEMDVDFLYYGDISCSQVFWKESVARQFWGRYLEVLDITPPPARSFQNWMICRKPA
jgi:SAM-dependent methyltransferase